MRNLYRYTKIPPVSRVYLTGAFLTTAACAVDIISPLTLYFNYELVVQKGQLWRLITPYLFFGVFSVDFLFHMYFLVSRCAVLRFLLCSAIRQLLLAVLPTSNWTEPLMLTFKPIQLSSNDRNLKYTFIPQNCTGSIQSITRRRRFPWSDGKLYLDVALWRREHFVSCVV